MSFEIKANLWVQFSNGKHKLYVRFYSKNDLTLALSQLSNLRKNIPNPTKVIGAWITEL